MGESQVSGILEGEDIQRTADALRAMGIQITRSVNCWKISGRGNGGLSEPEDVINCGNSGTSARLLLAVVASHDMHAILTGDKSLRRRPMDRVIEPARLIGAQFRFRTGSQLPISVVGTACPSPINYELPLPSAQVKSAVLLAGLQAPGKTTVIERVPTRDHTERLLKYFGVKVSVENNPKGRSITIFGQAELKPALLTVPADISSAAFFIVASLLIPGSDTLLTGVGVNPLRTGLIETLIDMGGSIELQNERVETGEPIADIRVRHSALRAVDVPPARAPSMIDEYPILAVAAAAASGRTIMRGLEELRVKESDRLISTFNMLRCCGVKANLESDGLVVESTGDVLAGGNRVATQLDHRIAMAALVAGMVSKSSVEIDHDEMINTSFPGFVELANCLGASIEPVL